MNKRNIKKTTPSANGRLLEGALVGTALGIVAGILIAPESGKKLRKDMRKLSGDFYNYIAPQVRKMKELGEAQYNSLITTGAKKYAQVKKLSIAEEKLLVKEGKRSWNKIKKQIA